MPDSISLDMVFSGGRKTTSNDRTIWSRGNAFSIEDRLEDLEAIFSNHATSTASLRDKILRLNGFFSVVIAEGSRVLVAVDRIRSFPLFYAVKGDTLFISDDPYGIQKRLGGRLINSIAIVEFLLTGYTVGDQTFDPRIRQMPAGEILTAEREPGGWHIERAAYYRFHHHNYLKDDLDVLQKMHQEEMERTVQRLMIFAGGALIAIPLSGGYDSRFILLALKRLGYPRLLAFSYGLPGNFEAMISRQVAGSLGIPWRFVPYTAEKWKFWFTSQEWADYVTMAEVQSIIVLLEK